MMEQDYILLIFNCVKYRFKALKQKETWILDLPKNILYFHSTSSKCPLDKDHHERVPLVCFGKVDVC